MEYLPYIPGIIGAIWIAYEDLKDREIHIAAFLVFFLGAIFQGCLNQEDGFFFNSLVNLAIVLIILALLFLLFSLSGKSLEIDKQLGMGDIIMLAGLCLWFTPAEFILFYSLSFCVLAIIATVALGLKKIDSSYPIPLAGGLAIFFILLLPLKDFLSLSFMESLIYG